MRSSGRTLALHRQAQTAAGTLLVTCRSRVICKKSRHLQRSRVICKEVASFAKKSRHGAAQSGHKPKIEAAPPPQKRREALFVFAWLRLQLSLCAPIVPLCDATFLQMTLARPEFFDFSVAGGHRKFENSGPSVTSKSKDAPFLQMTRLLQVASSLRNSS